MEMPPSVSFGRPYARGFITLISVLILAAMGLTLTLYLVLSTTDASQTSLAAVRSRTAMTLTDACSESALQQIKTTPSFTGSATLTVGGRSCTYTVISTGPTSRTLRASSTVDGIVRKDLILITQVSPSIVYTWSEVEGF